MMEGIEMPEQQTSLIWSRMKHLMDRCLPPARVFYLIFLTPIVGLRLRELVGF